MKVRYEFDKTRMEFRKVTHSVWHILGKAAKYFLVTASLAVVYYIVFSLVINTDSEKEMKQENQMYRKMYRDLAEREQLLGDVIEGLQNRDDEIYRRIFNTDAPDLGGLYPEDFLSGIDSVPDRQIVEYSRTKLDSMSKASERVEANFKRIMEAVSSGETLPPMTNPIGNFSYARTGASVGERINPFYKVKSFHGGLDLISQQGEPVLAAADGVVRDVVHSNKGLGNVVTLEHPDGYLTRYAHLENTRVAKGQKVTRGQKIGQVGMSGNSFAPHLHYEMFRDSLRLDPLNYLFLSASPDDYVRMLFMSVNTGQSMD